MASPQIPNPETMNTPRMKEAWESSSRTANGFYSTTTPMSVYARNCYEEGCKLERELATVTEQRDKLAKALEQLIKYQPRSTVVTMNAHHVWRDAREALRSITPNTKL